MLGVLPSREAATGVGVKRSGPPKRRTRLRKVRRARRGKVTEKMLDDACRMVVFARDGRQCAMCGSLDNIQWSHVRNRSYKSLQWYPLASKPLCAGCHRFKWHLPPPGFDPFAWFESRFPGRMKLIDEFYFANKGKKIDRRWLLESLLRDAAVTSLQRVREARRA